ncbi:hypothetical protein LUZ60_009498 [Juncus effusus]|nr:hypothetical protein LUZ60_009498 [Juncus effusus]
METDLASSSGGGGRRSGGGETVVVDSGRRRSSCGYCSSSFYSSVSHGFWAYSLTADDYQELLDRGWRRSGCYVYKPEMDKTCCPQYTIRLKAADFKPSKEQDRVLRRMQRYLDGALDSKTEKSKEKSNPETSSVPVLVPESQDELLSVLSDKLNEATNVFFQAKNIPLTGQNPKPLVKKVKPQMKQKLKDVIKGEEEELVYTCNVSFQITAFLKKVINENSGAISSIAVSPSAVADELAGAISSNIPDLITKACNGHINFYSKKDDSKESVHEPSQNDENAPQTRTHPDKSVQKLQENYENTPKKRKPLEIRTKRSEFDPVEYALYTKYQTLVHQDKKFSKESYTRFLVDTPIKPSFPNPNPNSSSPNPNPNCGFGSFHQQYLIDGKLVAVGVIDVLPKCLSSKYLFWDPDFAFLSLGKFSALKEVQWVKENGLEYYYLGYYIHSCAKMRYKAKYRPSELLCPLRYEWVPYEIARPLLDRSKYAVLSDFNKKENSQLLTTGEENGEKDGEENGGENGEDRDEMMHDAEAEFETDMDDDDDDDVAKDDSLIESIGEVVLDVNNTRVKYKDLEKIFVVRKSFISELEKQLHRYVKVVGKDLSRRIVYSLG